MSRRRQSTGENGDVDGIARALRERVSVRFGERSEIEELSNAGESADLDDQATALFARIGEHRRLETGECAGRDRGDRGPDSGDPCIHFSVRHLDASVRVVRAVLESRIASVALGAYRDRTVEFARLRALPFPEFAPSSREQLTVLAGRRSSFEDPVDWAIERVVAEAYRLELSELVRIQQVFSKTAES